MMGAKTCVRGGNRHAVLAGALMMTTALASMLSATPSWAQQTAASPPTIAQLQSERSFDIPAQPLTDALVAFGQQSGIQVTVNGTVARNISAPAVHGTMTSEQALRQLLAGSGLTYTMSGSTVAIEKPSQGADGTILLAPVTVEGATLRDPGQTEGTNSYAGSLTTVGSKIPASIRETPQSVSVVTRKRIEDRDFTTLREALAETTGVQVRTDDTRARIYSRGYQTSILHDGVQVPLGTQFETAPDLAFYDRVEVLRGPAGLFNGAGEPGGSINLVRKRPLDEFMVSTQGRIGSWNRYRADVDATGPLTESGKIRGRFVAAYEDRDWYIDTYESTKRMAYGTLEMDLTPKTILSAGMTYQDNDHSRFTGLPTFYTDGTRVDLARNTYICADWCRQDTYNADAFVELEHRFDNGVEAKASGRYINRSSDGKIGYVNSAIDPVTGNVDMLALKSDVLQEDYTFDGYVSAPVEVLGQEQRFLVGADYKYGTNENNNGNRVIPGMMNAFNPDHSAPEPATPITNRFRFKTEEIGTYGQARFKPGINWMTIVLGGRLTWWNSTGENLNTGMATSDTSVNTQFTPYGGLVFDLTDHISTYGSYTSIFQPQTAQTPTGDVAPPREGVQYELGVKGEFLDGRLLTHFAGFWLEDSNRATTIPGCIGSMCSEAAGLVRSRGIEAEISGEPLPGWNILAGYAYNYSTYVDDPVNRGEVYSPETPRHQVNLSTQYAFQDAPLRGLSIGGGMRFQSGVYTNLSAPYGRLEQGSVAIFNANIGYEVTENVSAQLTVNNLFDEEYYSTLGIQSRANLWGEPRSVMFSVRATW